VDDELDVIEDEDELLLASAAPIARYVTQYADGSASSITQVKPLASMLLMSIKPTIASSLTFAYTAVS